MHISSICVILYSIHSLTQYFVNITGEWANSVDNYSSLRENEIESISRILSSTTKAATNVAQTENNLTAQPQAEYRIASMSTTSSTLGVNSFNEDRLQTMFHGNYVTGGVFNINLALAKKEVKSPQVDPKRKKRRLIIESDGSQEFITWCYFRLCFCCDRIFLFFIRILTFCNRKYKYYCLYFSFIAGLPILRIWSTSFRLVVTWLTERAYVPTRPRIVRVG